MVCVKNILFSFHPNFFLHIKKNGKVFISQEKRRNLIEKKYLMHHKVKIIPISKISRSQLLYFPLFCDNKSNGLVPENVFESICYFVFSQLWRIESNLIN